MLAAFHPKCLADPSLALETLHLEAGNQRTVVREFADLRAIDRFEVCEPLYECSMLQVAAYPLPLRLSMPDSVGGSVVHVDGRKELHRLSPYLPSDVKRSRREAAEWFSSRIAAAWDSRALPQIDLAAIRVHEGSRGWPNDPSWSSHQRRREGRKVYFCIDEVMKRIIIGHIGRPSEGDVTGSSDGPGDSGEPRFSSYSGPRASSASPRNGRIAALYLVCSMSSSWGGWSRTS